METTSRGNMTFGESLRGRASRRRVGAKAEGSRPRLAQASGLKAPRGETRPRQRLGRAPGSPERPTAPLISEAERPPGPGGRWFRFPRSARGPGRANCCDGWARCQATGFPSGARTARSAPPSPGEGRYLHHPKFVRSNSWVSSSLVD